LASPAVFLLEHARANGVSVPEESKETVGVSSLAQKNRPPVVARTRPESWFPALSITNWLRGPATPRKRHSLILPYRFELIRKAAA